MGNSEIYDEEMENKLLLVEQYKIGDTVRYTKDGHKKLAT